MQPSATEALIIDMPVLVKSKMEDGRRMVELESSNQFVDQEGDVILQSALLKAADAFTRGGHCDLDHISEVGERFNPPILNKSAYIVGVPREVKDIGGNRTSVVCELHKARTDGVVTKADELWQSLTADPPVVWRASIFGYPTMDGWMDVSKAKPGTETYGATRYLITEMLWKSLAFTRNPQNDSIIHPARIITEKALIKAMTAKSFSLPVNPNNPTPTTEALANFMQSPRSREELQGAHYLAHIKAGKCPHAGGMQGNSVHSFREHFAGCCMEDPWTADLHALALMHLLKRS